MTQNMGGMDWLQIQRFFYDAVVIGSESQQKCMKTEDLYVLKKTEDISCSSLQHRWKSVKFLIIIRCYKNHDV